MNTPSNPDFDWAINFPAPGTETESFVVEVYRNQIFGTSLANAIEIMEAFGQNDSRTLAHNYNQHAQSKEDLDFWLSVLPPDQLLTPTKTMKESLEELFFNVTLSMASSPSLRYAARFVHSQGLQPLPEHKIQHVEPIRTCQRLCDAASLR